jgi:hypothetical protein
LKKYILICCMAGCMIGVCIFVYFRQRNENYYDLIIVSGATPLAVAEKVPPEVSLTVDGFVKKDYRFSGSALNGFASTRIRTREFDVEGKFLGAYAYSGIPVFNILEGIAPEKPEGADFKQPLDMLVSFSSASGKRVHFSFNEILMTDDRSPVTLAYDRKQILPATEKVRETYQLNVFKEKLSGLRLVCPREPDVTRYLDDVVRITFSVLQAPDDLLPRRQKGKCISKAILCVSEGHTREAVLQTVTRQQNDRWVKIGHGHGYEEVARAEGYDLRSFLTINFPGIHPSDFFLFVGCDGYRALFSGREIFFTEDGSAMMIVQSVNGTPPPEGLKLAPTADYFADRAMWGLSYVVRLDALGRD